MPSSLVIVALVVAWLVVLVPMIVRKRQEVAKTADSELAARVVRSGSGEAETGAQQEAEVDEEEAAMSDADQIDDDVADAVPDHPAEVADDAPHDQHPHEMSHAYYAEDPHYARRYRPGRGGFDPEAAAIIARAKYAFRQRVVLAMLIGAVVTVVVAAVVYPTLWWGHGAIDVVLITYLGYLRRQVRIETEIRERRLARMNRVRRARQRPVEYAEPPAYDEASTYDEAPAYAETPAYADEEPPEPLRRERVQDGPDTPAPPMHRAGAVVVDVDDEDPAFAELDEPGNLPYRRAVGE